MAIWAIADLHLAFGIPNKSMEVFGPGWEGYTDKIKQNWESRVSKDDLVLVPGDISWALHLEQAQIDLEWIHALPGTKVLLRGNHDYWWASLSKLEKIAPSSIHFIQNNAFNWNNVSIAGTRLWDSPEYDFENIEYMESTPFAKQNPPPPPNPEQDEKIFVRELGRLEMSLKALDTKAALKIAMTHYPPIGTDLKPSRASALLEKYHVDICVFGHLHNVRPDIPVFGVKNRVQYYLTATDYLLHTPLLIHP